jgi:malonyl-CoA/methylmalonyl-CoA synthetase
MTRTELPLIAAMQPHGEWLAIVDAEGEHFSFAELLAASECVAGWLLDRSAGGGRADLEEERVALMIPPGFSYVAALLGVWRAGGVAVPLCVSHPAPELAYVLDDTGAGAVLAHRDFLGVVAGLVSERGADLGLMPDVLTPPESEGSQSGRDLPEIASDRRALILYTSGTTGRPKGAVSTHAALAANIESLVAAWGWEPDDRILHVLPLHHTHGIVNALLCALWAGATCEMMARFEAEAVWRRLAGSGITVFMAVPTIYRKLEQSWDAAPEEERGALTAGASGLRLMVSGSAALPVPLFERWKEIGGHTLLERYGMTEIGMALSDPLDGERRAGCVGRPLPGVDIRLVDSAGNVVREAEGATGEIEVRGPAVFQEYWARPADTEAAFHDGWFRTGDEAILEGGAYRILGRQSVDIIKTGGFKVSALEIESVLAEHAEVGECAVVGVPDAEWGEAVCIALVSSRDIAREELREWAAERMARYKIPSRVLRVAELPRNAMGKVSKPRVKEWFESESIGEQTTE